MKGKGRDNKPAGGRANPANGGRGNAGRGGTKPPPRTGTVAAIGAFLDLGREMNHGSVSAWMRKFQEYTRTNYNSDISDIFGNEGIPGEMPVLVAPADILPDASYMVKEVWKKDRDTYHKNVIELAQDAKKVFGLMLGQIGDTSKATIRETESGTAAMTAQSPLLLMKAIILTHLSDPKLGADENLLRVRMAYETVKMEPNDILKYYFQRFKALRTGYEDTRKSLGLLPVNTPAITAHEELLTSMKFMKGLNSGYKYYVEFYEYGIKTWPVSLEEAYLEMAKVIPRKTVQPDRTNVLAVKNAGGEKVAGDNRGKPNGGAGRGKGGRTGYGTRPGNCNKCKEPGHYSYECPAQDSPAAAPAANGGLKSVN